MCWDKVTSNETHHVSSANDVAENGFTDVLQSEWPIVLNWSIDMQE